MYFSPLLRNEEERLDGRATRAHANCLLSLLLLDWPVPSGSAIFLLSTRTHTHTGSCLFSAASGFSLLPPNFPPYRPSQACIQFSIIFTEPTHTHTHKERTQLVKPTPFFSFDDTNDAMTLTGQKSNRSDPAVLPRHTYPICLSRICTHTLTHAHTCCFEGEDFSLSRSSSSRLVVEDAAGSAATQNDARFRREFHSSTDRTCTRGNTERQPPRCELAAEDEEGKKKPTRTSLRPTGTVRCVRNVVCAPARIAIK